MWRGVIIKLGVGLAIAIAIALIASCGLSGQLGAGASSVVGGSTGGSPVVSTDYGSLPMPFEDNQGQADPTVQFIGKSRGYNLYLTGTDLIFDVTVQSPGAEDMILIAPGSPSPTTAQSALITVSLMNANKAPESKGENQLSGLTNYLFGPDPSKWITNVKTYEKVRYEEVYPGIGMLFYGVDGIVEHDFIVSPGADPKLIKMSIQGAQKVTLLSNGNLDILVTDNRDLIMKKPIVYQTIGGQKSYIESAYEILEDNTVGFKLANYDTSLELVIDPATLTYSTFLGGSSDDLTWGVAVDSSGNSYTVGYAKSTAATFPETAGSLDETHNGGIDAFVTKLNSTGTANMFTTYLGGTGDDLANSIQVDSSGNTYITGYTTSTDFPTASAFQSAHGGGTYDAFLTKLGSAGTTLTYSTYFGGTGFDRGAQIALDTTSTGCITAGSACVVLVGTTSTSSSFSTASLAQSTYGGGEADAFVAKFDSSGSRTLCTYLGGTSRDLGTGVVVDGANPALVYVTGETRSSDFPTAGASVLDTTLGGSQDAFVVKLTGDFVTKTYATYFGGADKDGSAGIGLNAGSAYIVGTTRSSNLLTTYSATGTFDTSLGGTMDVYIAKLNTGATAVTYATFIGGSGDEEALGFQNIVVDANGEAWITGKTTSTVANGFPNTNAITTPTGLTDLSGVTAGAFVLKVAGKDTSVDISFSTYLAGTTSGKSDVGVGLAVDTASSNVYVTGIAESTNFPTTAGVVDTSQNGGLDGFIAKVATPPITFVSTATNNDSVGVTSIVIDKRQFNSEMQPHQLN